jgi:hypothetical protein
MKITIKSIFIKPIFIIGFAWLFSTHCRQSIDLDLQVDDRRLLVEGYFSNDTAFHQVVLRRSGSITTSRPMETVSGASISLTDGTDTYHYAETDDPGRYQTVEKCAGTGGHTYCLTITGIDVDEDGAQDTYTATGMMPVPLKFDSLHLKFGTNGDGWWGDRAYYTAQYNSPYYVYKESLCNHYFDYPLSERLGNGEMTRFANEGWIARVAHPDSVALGALSFYRRPGVQIGDTITLFCENFTKAQYDFLMELDNHVSSDNPTIDHLYDALRIPGNLSTNIEPASKAAGYFLIYSVSSIDVIYRE